MRDYTRFEENLLRLVSAKTLLLLDRGFYHFLFWQQLIAKGIDFITRIKINAAIESQKVFTDSYSLRDRLLRFHKLQRFHRVVLLQEVVKEKITLWLSDFLDSYPKERLDKFLLS